MEALLSDLVYEIIDILKVIPEINPYDMLKAVKIKRIGWSAEAMLQ